MKRSSNSGTPRMAVLAVATLIAAIGAAAPVHAKKHDVKRMKYKNQGAYAADFEVRYKYDGVSCQLGSAGKKKANDILNGETYTLDLTHDLVVTSNADSGHGTAEQCLVDGSIPDGVEVWGVVFIAGGDDEPCRKDGNKFYFSASGGTVTYKSKGTTLNNNRCRIADLP